MRSFLALAALFLLLVARPVLAVDTFVPGQLCGTLGASHMSADHSGLVVCGRTTGDFAENCGDGGCTWKSMSGGGGSCYTDSALATGLPVGSPCKISGFTIKGSEGIWGTCCDGYGMTTCVSRPAGGGCGTIRSYDFGESYLCCQN